MNRYTTTHPETGQTAKRGSQNRTYTHAVWAQRPARLIAARLERDVAYLTGLLAAYRDAAQGKGRRYEDDQRRATRFGREATTPEAWTQYADEVEASLAETRAKLDAGVADGDWCCDGWCGRPDLADKKAAGLRRKGLNVVITEAVAA